MSVVAEPELAGVNIVNTTNAAALTAKLVNILAVPGAGLRYRIYSVDVGFDMNGTAVPANIVNFINAVLGILLSISIQQPSARTEWGMGNPLPANGQFNLTTYPSVAVVGGIPVSVSCGYVVEQV